MPQVDMTDYSDVAFVKELRDLAHAHYDLDVRVELSDLADRLKLLVDHFTAVPSQKNLTYLVSMWSHAKVFYDSVVLNGGNSPKGGHGEVEPLLKAA